MQKPYFSIIVPVYMVEKYVSHCIEDILKQTFQSYELILVDDGSADSSGAICDRYSKAYKQIKAIHTKNQGLPAARNNGIKAASGEWFVFIDSDDRIDSRYFLKAIYEKTKNRSIDILTYGCIQASEKTGMALKRMYADMGTMNQFASVKEKVRWCVTYSRLSVSAWLHACSKRFLIQNQLYFNEDLKTAEDIEWFFRALSCEPEICGMNGTPYRYIIRENSICTGVKKSGFWKYREEAVRLSVNAVKNARTDREYKKILYSALAYHYYVQLADIGSEPVKEKKREAFDRMKDLEPLQRYACGRKSKISRCIVRMFGIEKGAEILSSYVKARALLNGYPVRSMACK